MCGKLGFRGGEIELIVVHVAAAFEPSSGFAFVRDEAVETSAQESLKAGFRGVVAGEVVLLECVRKERLRQIFCVFVIGLPLEANVFVRGFPVARQDRVERATTDDLIVTARALDCRVIGDREAVKWATYVSVWIHI